MRILVGLVAVMVVVAGLLPVMTKTRARAITLVAKDMAFYVEGGAEPNPILEVKAGETVRVLLRNRDRGMTHDFAVPSLKAEMDPIDWNEEDAIVFEAPDDPGIYEYVCRPHLLMMKGTLKVIRD
jgi:plastocyanin